MLNTDINSTSPPAAFVWPQDGVSIERLIHSLSTIFPKAVMSLVDVSHSKLEGIKSASVPDYVKEFAGVAGQICVEICAKPSDVSPPKWLSVDAYLPLPVCYLWILDQSSEFDRANSSFYREQTKLKGLGLFTDRDLSSGDEIASFDGPYIFSDLASRIDNSAPLKLQDRAIQVGKRVWRDSLSLARTLNHSCNPNCGIRGRFTIVATRQIEAGEELVFDYDMTEDSDWSMTCHCGSKRCKKTIAGFSHLNQSQKNELGNHISDWLYE